MNAAEFKAWFPGGQFDGVDDGVVNTYLTRATPWFNADAWGDFYDEGLANWLAHSIIVGNAETAQAIDEVDADDAIEDRIGPIMSRRSEKNIELAAKDPFMRTSYGRRYRQLARWVGLGGMTA